MKSSLDSSIKYIKTDILVIGAGGAGLRAAIEAKKSIAKTKRFFTTKFILPFIDPGFLLDLEVFVPEILLELLFTLFLAIITFSKRTF